MAVSRNPKAAIRKVAPIAMTDHDNDNMKVRDLHEKNRQNDKDHEESLEAKLANYALSRYKSTLKEKGITLDVLMSMDEQAIHKLEDEIIPARAILKHKKFEQFIQKESMVTDYRSEYIKNNRNSSSVCVIFVYFLTKIKI